MKTIYFITSNKGKLLEAKEKLSDVDVEVVQRNLDYLEIPIVINLHLFSRSACP